MDRLEPIQLLHADFDAQAARTPAATALRCGDDVIDYAGLRQRSDRIAAALRHAGIAAGSYVALHVDRSIDYVACVLGILKANAAVVPLPPAYPRARVDEILGFSQLDAVIAPPGAALDVPPGTRLLHVDELSSACDAPGAPRAGDPGQPAFVLCSSGSTGKPKMIVRSHRSFYHRLGWMWATHPFEDGERCVQKSTMTTTHSLYELFEPLLRGVPTLILGDHETRDLGKFWQKVRAWSPTRLLVVPSALQVSLEFPDFEPPPLKVLVLMGEYVHHKLAGKAIDAFPAQTALYSIYGSTEASSTLLCDLRRSHRPGHELPLGRPITPEVQAHVLGPDLRPVARGESGLLHFGGPALFSEYFRDPELTASVFVESPVAHGRLYNTHDQVRLTDDGSLEYIGRTDHTVKVRGFRVDLEEVERTLLLHPQVHHAAVVLANKGSPNAALLGFYAPSSVDRASVQAFMAGRLPAYMVPSALVGLDALPRTASGKTDRRRLLEQYALGAAGETVPGALTGTERRVAEVWRDLLGHGQFSPDSGFFEVGGTSLTAFGVVHRLREAFALDPSLMTDQVVYRHPTLRGLAEFIDRALSGDTPGAPEPDGVLVTLKTGTNSESPPLFLIASAGGTLGAYEKLVRALELECDVVGVRDPYLWGARDATLGFREWVGSYIDAMRQRQPRGPYHLLAYSSAGAFGYEIARRLRQEGEEVGLVAIVDPFGLDRPTPDSFGYRVMQARFGRPYHRLLVRAQGWLHALRLRSQHAPASTAVDIPMPHEQVARRIGEAKRSKSDILGFSALLELNTGLPFALSQQELSALQPDQYFGRFLERAHEAAPDFDAPAITRIFEQYFGLQVPAQQNYPLQPYDGPMLLVELAGRNRGLVAAQLRPYVRGLHVRRLKVRSGNGTNGRAVKALPSGLRDHFLCMRDEQFVAQLAATLRAKLPHEDRSRSSP